MERALKGRPQCAQKDAVVILSSETVGGLSLKRFAEESLQVRDICRSPLRPPFQGAIVGHLYPGLKAWAILLALFRAN
jgi:hypothetical protein